MKISSTVLVALVFSTIIPSGEASAATWRQDTVSYDATTGTPSFISGEFHVSAPANQPVEVARTFLRSQKGAMGLKFPDGEWKVNKIIELDEVGMSHVRFNQTVRGVPVFGSEVFVHMKGNVVTSMNGNYLRSPSSQALRIDVQADDAAELAVENLRDRLMTGAAQENLTRTINSLDLDKNPELVFYSPEVLGDQGKGLTLAWQVSVSGYLFFINAQDASVVAAWDNVHFAMNRTIYDANHTQSLPGTKVCTENGGCTNRDTDTNNAYDQFGETWTYFKNTHNWDSVNGKGAELVGTVHYGTNFVNAFWNGTQMVFGDGMVGLDVTAHELGHGVCQFTAGLVYKNQSGALNEAFSDIWGAMVDRDDWLMGEDLSIGAIRSLENPSDYGLPEDMDEYQRYFLYDNGGVHINMGIPSYAVYLLSDGGTHKGVTVVGQGRDVAEDIMWRVESTKLTSSAKFTDWANASVAACGELFGASSAKCQQTSQAMKAVKILK